MTEEEYVNKSVAIQIGNDQPVAQGRDAMLRALKGSSGMAVAYVPAEEQLYALDGPDELKRVSRKSVSRNLKTKGALDSILRHNPQFEFIVDMQDRRLRDIADKDAAPFPVFCFNRHSEDRHRILWPLPIYHDLDGDQFLSGIQPDFVDWEDKIPRVIWRGITGGRSAGTSPGRGEGMRLKAAFRRYREGRMSMQKLHGIVSTAPRFRAVAYVKGDARYDFGFVDGDGYTISQTPMHVELERPRVPRHEMQKFKYIAVLRGLDVGSSFYWVMNSGSVGFVQDTPFETFASSHFKPWENYIPFSEDCSDLHQAFDWAESHVSDCKQMASNSAQICTLVARQDLRERISRNVVEAIATKLI